MSTFDNLGMSLQLLATVKTFGYEQPTMIQEKSIPLIIQGKDVVGESATGTGKTLAFGCGVVEKVVPRQGIQALILTPTRELAEQVMNALAKMSKDLRMVAVYGGVSIGPQMDAIRSADVVIATPGRLLDHLERRTINLSKVKLLVLDEADRMLDMGFIDDVERIIKVCPKERQTLFFSATIEGRVQELVNKHMRSPQKVVATKMVDPSKLKQVYYEIHKSQKLSLLVHLCKNESAGLIMVFCNTRGNTDFVAKNLRANGVDAVAIHGGFTQNKRSKTLSMFNKGKVGVLVCTDVAARGLHIDNVSHVYNYDIPKDSTDYVHRIGRTARAGEEGKVMNLLCEADHDNFSRVWRDHREFAINKIHTPEVERIKVMMSAHRRPGFARGGSSPRFGGGGRGGGRFSSRGGGYRRR